MFRATDRMIAFAEEIAIELEIEEEWEVIFDEGADFDAVNVFINNNKDEFYNSRKLSNKS